MEPKICMSCIILTEVNIYQCESTTEAELLETVLGPGRLFLGETQTIKRFRLLLS